MCYHNNSKCHVDAVEEGYGVVILRSDGLASESLKNVPSQNKNKQQIKSQIAIEESSEIEFIEDWQLDLLKKLIVSISLYIVP